MGTLPRAVIHRRQSLSRGSQKKMRKHYDFRTPAGSMYNLTFSFSSPFGSKIILLAKRVKRLTEQLMRCRENFHNPKNFHESKLCSEQFKLVGQIVLFLRQVDISGFKQIFLLAIACGEESCKSTMIVTQI